MNKARKHQKFYHALLNVPPKSLPSVFQHCKGEQIQSLIEILYNIRKFDYSEKEKKKLCKYTSLCKKLLSTVGRKNRKVSVAAGRRVLKSQNKQVGGFLPYLLLPLMAKALKFVKKQIDK